MTQSTESVVELFYISMFSIGADDPFYISMFSIEETSA
jgi:hypothetical protein